MTGSRDYGTLTLGNQVLPIVSLALLVNFDRITRNMEIGFWESSPPRSNFSGYTGKLLTGSHEHGKLALAKQVLPVVSLTWKVHACTSGGQVFPGANSPMTKQFVMK